MFVASTLVQGHRLDVFKPRVFTAEQLLVEDQSGCMTNKTDKTDEQHPAECWSVLRKHDVVDPNIAEKGPIRLILVTHDPYVTQYCKSLHV